MTPRERPRRESGLARPGDGSLSRRALLYAGAGLLAPVRAAATAGPPLLLHVEPAALLALDAARLEPAQRLVLPHPLLGPPLQLAAGAPAFVAAAAGWLARIETSAAATPLAVTQQRETGLDWQALALSGDGRWLAAACQAPAALVLLDTADLGVARELTGQSLDRRRRGDVTGVRCLPWRRSFVATLPALDELWEVSYDPAAEPLFDGLVHDYRMGEGIASPGFLGVRRSRVEAPVTQWLAAAGQPWLAGLDASGAAPRLVVMHLDVRRPIATVRLSGAPQPAAGAAWTTDGRTLLALPDAALPLLHRVESQRWSTLPPLPLPAPARRVLAHPASAWVVLWLDGSLLALDRDTLATQARWRAEGPIAAVDFSVDGRFLFARREGGGGWLLSAALQPLRRIDAVPGG
jgi:hypothetical protein